MSIKQSVLQGLSQAAMIDKDFYLGHLADQKAKKTSMSQKINDKTNILLKELSNPLININKVRSICFTGIPDEINGLRSLVWKLLLTYLPYNRSKWDSLLESNRNNYKDFRHDFLHIRKEKLEPAVMDKLNQQVSSAQVGEKQGNPYVKCVAAVTLDSTNVVDHPLSLNPSSEWNVFFKDLDLWDEIEKDTKRTRTEITLFNQATSQAMTHCYSKTLSKEDSEVHSDVLSRILFVYGKLNPGVKYVQGMNELLAPLYHCFNYDENPAFKAHAEADAFYCFTILMGEVKENFVKSLDNTDGGIQSRMTDLNNLLKKVDQVVWTHLNDEKVHPHYYTLRWIMLLLTQEFELMDVMRLWDTLFSHPNKIDFLNYCCLAMVLNIRGAILKDDFPGIMEALQKTASTDVEAIIKRAISLYKQFANPEDMSYIVFQ